MLQHWSRRRWQTHRLLPDDPRVSGVSKEHGNDLSTPRPEYGFAGLKPGDRWCLCADRWVQADAYGAAPHVVLECTHINTLKIIPFEVLRVKALDMN